MATPRGVAILRLTPHRSPPHRSPPRHSPPRPCPGFRTPRRSSLSRPRDPTSEPHHTRPGPRSRQARPPRRVRPTDIRDRVPDSAPYVGRACRDPASRPPNRTTPVPDPGLDKLDQRSYASRRSSHRVSTSSTTEAGASRRSSHQVSTSSTNDRMRSTDIRDLVRMPHHTVVEPVETPRADLRTAPHPSRHPGLDKLDQRSDAFRRHPRPVRKAPERARSWGLADRSRGRR
ncbi:hypothetical protein PA27867_1191 [Cryobacterium arcticum]|uniref:Uncharacterized protein n=1 Tax=Cryobacterium arcticum TaxID=670052 RepID=A0A1B1BHT0_9MICO|nr:hypothetical protein PA27867_1191 [Cryobacterium arcticum]